MLGSFVVAACLLVLGWTKEIVEYFIEEGEFSKACTVALAVSSIYAVDFSINAGKSGPRSAQEEFTNESSSILLSKSNC